MDWRAFALEVDNEDIDLVIDTRAKARSRIDMYEVAVQVVAGFDRYMPCAASISI